MASCAPVGKPAPTGLADDRTRVTNPPQVTNPPHRLELSAVAGGYSFTVGYLIPNCSMYVLYFTGL